MRRGAFALLVAALVTSACGSVPTQTVEVSITDGDWTASPATLEGEFGEVSYRLTNDGGQAHHVIVGSTLVSAGELEAHIAQHGLANLLAELQGLEARGIGAALIRGHRGHFHPGGPDEVDLPAHALVISEDDGATVRWFFADPLEPGGVAEGTSRAGKFGEGVLFETVSYVVMCADPAHADRREFVVFGTNS